MPACCACSAGQLLLRGYQPFLTGNPTGVSLYVKQTSPSNLGAASSPVIPPSVQLSIGNAEQASPILILLQCQCTHNGSIQLHAWLCLQPMRFCCDSATLQDTQRRAWHTCLP